MERRENWEYFLSEFLFKRKDSTFRYGRNDCCLFVADAIERMTGVDPAVEFRGKYRTKAQAKNLLINFAGGTISETVKRLTINYGMPGIEINLAGRGDVALVINGARGEALGIVDMTGEQVAVPGYKGLVYFPMIVIQKAWRVG